MGSIFRQTYATDLEKLVCHHQQNSLVDLVLRIQIYTILKAFGEGFNFIPKKHFQQNANTVTVTTDIIYKQERKHRRK